MAKKQSLLFVLQREDGLFEVDARLDRLDGIDGLVQVKGRARLHAVVDDKTVGWRPVAQLGMAHCGRKAESQRVVWPVVCSLWRLVGSRGHRRVWRQRSPDRHMRDACLRRLQRCWLGVGPISEPVTASRLPRCRIWGAVVVVVRRVVIGSCAVDKLNWQGQSG